ncbi:MAG: helicase C-terminal domain-containing protein, partial [Thermoleophilaceae bacterium]
MPTFADLGLSAPVVEAVAHLGYDSPTPIQEQAIPELLAGRDVIGQAQTGTGKTAAFGLPLLEYVDPRDPEVQALVLTPTRELCIQVTQAIRAYGERRGVGVVAVFGGAPIRSQVAQLKAGAQVVVGTVGRVMDLMSRHQLVVSSVRFVVLDEADEMLDLGFLEDVETILSRAPGGRQTALFSATMPQEIRRLAEARMLDPVTVKVRAATLTIDTVEHFFIEAGDREKPEALARVIEAEKPTQAIVFVRTKVGVDRLARVLDGRGLRVKALHGDMSQGSRDGVMIAFKDGRERLLVATDVAARGLDITGVTHVINYDPPNSPEIYVHRIGRTGRVGRSGRAITVITPKQRRDLEAIERHASIKIAEWSAEEARPERRREAAVRAATLTIDTVEQFYVEVGDREKPDALARVLKADRPAQAIIFVRTKIGVDRLARGLSDRGVRAKALHGDMSQGSRDGVMIAFKDGRERLLVATDVAARGLDISGVTHV